MQNAYAKYAKISTIRKFPAIRYYYPASSSIFTLEIIIGIAFVTIMLIGYVRFRNEQEVKSASFMLNLLIFLGCYLNLIFLLLLLYLQGRIQGVVRGVRTNPPWLLRSHIQCQCLSDLL